MSVTITLGLTTILVIMISVNKFLIALVSGLALVVSCAGSDTGGERWTEEKANEWWASQEWPVGCCFMPSYAINQFEMWQESTYNPEVIDREFGLCEDLGFNLVRLFIHEDLWFADREGFMSRIDEVLSLAQKHGIRATFTFCTNGGESTEQLGEQPQAIPGVHGGGHWCQTPKSEIFFNKERWPEFKAYVQDILRTFKHDGRILYWCIYNEPENLRQGRNCLELMTQMYAWAREINPDQPITSPIWVRPGYKGDRSRLDMINFVTSNSDIISFHCYYAPDELETFIRMLKPFNRPMVCQEYMARTYNSTFQGCLPIFKREKIAALNWGLVEGKCNFHYPWGHKLEDGEPELWFHDIFYEDYTPFSQEEVDFIKSITSDKSTAGIQQ